MCIYSIQRQNVNDTITKGSNYWVCLLPKFHTFYVPLQYTSSTDSRGQRSKTRKTKLFLKRSLKIPKNDRNMINNTSNHAFMKRWLKNKHKISNKYVTSNDYQTTFQVLSISRCWIKSKYYTQKRVNTLPLQKYSAIFLINEDLKYYTSCIDGIRPLCHVPQNLILAM